MSANEDVAEGTYEKVMRMLQGIDSGFSDTGLAINMECEPEEGAVESHRERIRAGLDYDRYMVLARAFIQSGNALPEPLDEFALGVMDQTIKRRGKRGKPAYKNRNRNDWIVLAIRAVLYNNQHIRATRNDEGGVYSACDLVSECLIELGYPDLSYAAVKKVWMTHQMQLPIFLFKRVTNK